MRSSWTSENEFDISNLSLSRLSVQLLSVLLIGVTKRQSLNDSSYGVMKIYDGDTIHSRFYEKSITLYDSS